MSVGIQIYSNANSASQTISFDFLGNVLASDNNQWSANNAADATYYFIATTSARQDNSGYFSPKIVVSLDDLALNNNTKTSPRPTQSQANVATAYTDIKSMIIDYTWDFINGHTDNQYLSGCSQQRPMKFR